VTNDEPVHLHAVLALAELQPIGPSELSGAVLGLPSRGGQKHPVPKVDPVRLDIVAQNRAGKGNAKICSGAPAADTLASLTAHFLTFGAWLTASRTTGQQRRP
jgi:hypothetical protein